MAKRFEIIEHTADIGIAAYGSALERAFANAAYALFSLMVDPKSVHTTLCREVEVTAEDQEDLLVAWLNELLYLHEVESVLFRRFEVRELTESRLRSRCYGELIDPARHKMKMGIKAATYHMLTIQRENGFRVQVLLDV